MDTNITLKATVSEFDLLRGCVEAKAKALREEIRTGTNGIAKHTLRQEEAQVLDLLRKLGGK